MYTNEREAYRQTFIDVWHKHQQHALLTPLESQLIEIILAHPEYHELLNNPEEALAQEYSLSDNPFMHMSLHLSIREQAQTDRPKGIRSLYDTLMIKNQDKHVIEHRMMDALLEMIKLAHHRGTAPTDDEYLAALKNI